MYFDTELRSDKNDVKPPVYEAQYFCLDFPF